MPAVGFQFSQFNPARPNKAWVAGIVYIRTRSGGLYLAVVLDLFARKVGCRAMVSGTVQRATAQRQPAADVTAHSDQRSQHASAAYQAWLNT